MSIDVSCFIGNWPFRKIAKNGLADLRKVHADNQITVGYVSSLNSIFYNDPFEGDEELHEMIQGTEYRHVLTVNPSLPGFAEDIVKAIARFSIRGVRIYPGYHGYSLSCPAMERLCEILRQYRLPLFLTLRMEDERLHYLLRPEVLSMQDLDRFLESQPHNRILLTNIRYAELMALKSRILKGDHIVFDTSGLKDKMFVVEDLLQTFPAKKMLYGSLHPLYCLKSTWLLVDKAEVEPSVKLKIFRKNAENAIC